MNAFPATGIQAHYFISVFFPRKSKLFSLFNILMEFCWFFFLSEKRQILWEMNKKTSRATEAFFIYCDRIILKAKRVRDCDTAVFKIFYCMGKLFFLQVTYYSYETVNQKIFKNVFPLTQILVSHRV